MGPVFADGRENRRNTKMWKRRRKWKKKKKMVPRAEVKGKKGLTILNDADLKTKAMNK